MKRFFKLLGGVHGSEWAVALWSALSCGFFAWIAAVRNDDLISRRELLLITGTFLIAMLIFTLLFIRLFRVRLKKTIPALLALLFGFIFVFFGKDFIHPDFGVIRNLDLRVVEMDDNARTDLVWAYWAAPSETAEGSPRHVRDISFNRAIQSGDWEKSEDGGISTAEVGARLRFKLEGMHFNQPVLCVIARGGRALVEVGFNGTRNFYHLNGTDTDPLVIETLNPTLYEILLSYVIYGFAIAGVLFWLILFLLNREISEKSRVAPSSTLFILLAAFFLPVFLLGVVLVLTNILPFGEATFLRIDMGRQYAAFLAYLRDMPAEGNDLFYSFSKGVGGNMYFLYSYYLANPINRLVGLFGARDLPLAVTLLVLIRIGLCGVSASLYFQQLSRRRIPSLLFSTAYALMSYVMINAENYFFIDGVIFLPLVLTGLELADISRPFKKRRLGYALYVVSLAAVLMINFYVGYMVAVFAVIYRLFLLLLSASEPSVGVYLKRLLKFAAATLLALGLAAVVLLPVVRQLPVAPKSLSPQELSFLPNFDFIDLFSVNYAGAYDLEQYKSGLPPIFSGTVMTFLAILFFMNSRISLREKLLSAAVLAIFLASLHIQLLDVFWHGFSTPVWWPYRYAFIFSFWVIRLACRCYAEKTGVSGWDAGLTVFIILLISVTMEKLKFPYLTIHHLYLEVGIALLIAAVFFAQKRLIKPIHSGSTLLLLNCISLIVNATVIIGLNSGESLPAETFREYTVSTSSLIGQLKAHDPDFYRMENLNHLNENDPMQFSYAGLSHYSSTVNQFTMNMLSQFGVSQTYYFSRYDPGLPVAMDAFWGIRYVIAPEEKMLKPYHPVIQQEEAKAWQNPYALPIGILAHGPSSLIDRYGSANPFTWVNRIYPGLAGQELGDIFIPALKEETTAAAGNPEVWTLTVQQPGALYGHIKAPADFPARAYAGNRDLTDVFNENRYGIANLGDYQAGDKITLEFDEPRNFENRIPPSFYSEDLAVLQSYVNLLAEPGVALRKESSSHLSGTVEADAGQTRLVFTIPAEKGWQLRIDGNPVPLEAEMGLLLAADLPAAGAYDIDLQYTPPGYAAGLSISLVSVVLFLLWLGISGGAAKNRKRRNSHG